MPAPVEGFIEVDILKYPATSLICPNCHEPKVKRITGFYRVCRGCNAMWIEYQGQTVAYLVDDKSNA
jgi:ribosomal protein L37AE/L43A